MRFRKFTIENFKGIKSAVIELSDTGTARVYTLVGLNESGKTTVLEAIHSFSPDSDTEIVVGNAKTAAQQRQLTVPRSRISDFSGDVSVEATIDLSEDDKDDLVKFYMTNGLTLDKSSLQDQFKYARIQTYLNGDFKGNYYKSSLKIKVKGPRQKKYRDTTGEEVRLISVAMTALLPAIAYFPTFVFDFPDRIYLSPRNDDQKNSFYRKLFQDILDYAARGHTIEEHIVKRIRKPEYKTPWLSFWPTFKSSNETDQINHVIDLASRTVTNVVYRKWNEIFGEDTRNKEIQISWDVEKGIVKKTAAGAEVEPEEHDLYVTFLVKDGTNRFPIRTRSLGFRWFFSFLLFTQFRAARGNKRPLVFLLDEPASNLHAAAQQKLIESFPEIAKNPHALVYSTHSHYMVEPNWLEQAYIVQNRSAMITDSVIDSVSIDDAAVDVVVTPYKRFVADNPRATSYFQPIIDRLNVVPSKFDVDKGGLILEGKSDYYILEYFNQRAETKMNLFPGLGAGTLGSLVALMRGWGLPVRVVLDSDAAGRKEKQRYMKEFALTDSNIVSLDELMPGVNEVEDLVHPIDAHLFGSNQKGGKPLKKMVLAVFQQHLASGTSLPLSEETEARAAAMLAAMSTFLAS